MVLSISSFRKERSVRILALAASLALLGALANASWPDTDFQTVRDRDQFWQRKVHAHADHSYNIIATGDSRVYRGLSPDVFDMTVRGTRTLNFGFSGGGHNAVIFGAIDKLLVENGNGVRAVILGITPYSLTPKAQMNGQYVDTLKKPRPGWDAGFNDFFRPLSLRRVKQITLRRTEQPLPFIYKYYDNGWVSSDWRTREPESELETFRSDFNGNRVDPATIQSILRQTKQWRAQGIKVLAYRPPTTPDMVEVEKEHSGFDEAAFIQLFKDAGGIWVDPGADFTTYDGSHLVPESAERLSKILAAAVAGSTKHP